MISRWYTSNGNPLRIERTVFIIKDYKEEEKMSGTDEQTCCEDVLSDDEFKIQETGTKFVSSVNNPRPLLKGIIDTLGKMQKEVVKDMDEDEILMTNIAVMLMEQVREDRK